MESKKDLEPLPPDLEDAEVPAGAIALRQENLTNMALLDPKAIEERLLAREKTLATLRAVAIQKSHPFDWTLYKDKEGRVVGVPRDSAAVQIRKWMGISIFNYRPTINGSPVPEITTEKGKDGTDVTVATMWADGICALTGEPVEGVSYSIQLGAPFTGSGSMADLRASCRTGLDTKVTRILSGLRKVPEDTLKAMGVDTEKCHRGMGFGTSAERQSSKVAEEGVAEQAAALRAEILKRVGGDTETAKQLCKEITKGDKPGGDGKVFPGFTSVERMTQGWMIDAAWKKLKAHPMFGDDAREPGGEG